MGENCAQLVFGRASARRISARIRFLAETKSALPALNKDLGPRERMRRRQPGICTGLIFGRYIFGRCPTVVSLKILSSKEREGSSPVVRTKYNSKEHGVLAAADTRGRALITGAFLYPNAAAPGVV